MINLDEIRERTLRTRDGFYHVVGAYRVMREADFDALTAEVERLRVERDHCRRAMEFANAEAERMRGEVERERAAVVAFLLETRATSETAYASDDLDYAIAVIERGKHRQKEKTP